MCIPHKKTPALNYRSHTPLPSLITYITDEQLASTILERDPKLVGSILLNIDFLVESDDSQVSQPCIELYKYLI